MKPSRSLSNVRGICYANAILQALCNVEPFRAAVAELANTGVTRSDQAIVIHSLNSIFMYLHSAISLPMADDSNVPPSQQCDVDHLLSAMLETARNMTCVTKEGQFFDGKHMDCDEFYSTLLSCAFYEESTFSTRPTKLRCSLVGDKEKHFLTLDRQIYLTCAHTSG